MEYSTPESGQHIKRVRVDQLSPGMYVHDMNAGWLQHPFMTGSFKLRDWSQIEKIRDHGIETLYIDASRGLDVSDATTIEEVHREVETRMEALVEPVRPVRRVAMRQELAEARKVREQARTIVTDVMQEVRSGKLVEIEKVALVVETVVDSILRNRNALFSITRLKQSDEYTFLHSVSVCALMSAFAASMGMDAATVQDAGLGGLLHDIGKVKIPDQILNKPGKLTDDEFAVMKEHVIHGSQVLDRSDGIDPRVVRVAREHHERFDGSGYTLGMQGEQLSELSRMIAVVDVYDAITSNRCYSRGLEPASAVRKLYEWSRNHFHPEMVEHFIKCVGIYPVGTLVLLESGLLGFVIDFMEDTILRPTVRVVYDTRKQWYVSPYDLDLAAQSTADRILSWEQPERWKLAPENYTLRL